MAAQDVAHAVRVHDYIATLEELTDLSLKDSPIILESPSQPVILKIPNLQKSYSEYVEPLYEDIGDHDLLFKAIRTGWPSMNSCARKVPRQQIKYGQQWNHAYALNIAQQRGYIVADDLLKQQVAYGEYEAYYAAREILYGKTAEIWSRKPNFKTFVQDYIHWHTRVKLLTSQFIVPSSQQRDALPYVLDQLWLVAHDDHRVRLLSLEVDGEHHIFNKGRSKTLGRDSHLKKLGYETYRVASWWCRVDPYRVVCEFLKVSGIFPDAMNYLIGAELNSIDEYKCGICQAPMVRSSWNWIQKCQIGHSTVLAHSSCVTGHSLEQEKMCSSSASI